MTSCLSVIYQLFGRLVAPISFLPYIMLSVFSSNLHFLGNFKDEGRELLLFVGDKLTYYKAVISSETAIFTSKVTELNFNCSIII